MCCFHLHKDVIDVLTLAERYENSGVAKGRVEGRVEGRTEGIAIGANRLAELIREGFSVDEALLKINEEHKKHNEQTTF